MQIQSETVLSGRNVIIHAEPTEYRNDIYDIANLFYDGDILFSDCDNNVRGECGQPVDRLWIVADIKQADIKQSDIKRAVGGQLTISCKFSYPAKSIPSAGADVLRVSKPLTRSDRNGTLQYQIKMSLYRILRDRYGRSELPWGALVGIRPVKLAGALLEAGEPESAVVSALAEKYDVSEGKTRLLAKVWHTQTPILKAYKPGMDFMLYVGIPFCRTKCAYCSFPSDAHNKADKYEAGYLEALTHELAFVGEMTQSLGMTPRAVYIGGGTPTAISAYGLSRLFAGIEDAFPALCPDEITVEAGRADTVDAQKLAAVRAGTKCSKRTRLCINPQTMNDKTLGVIGRRHTADDVHAAFRLAREAGFSDINMDIIAGLPGETAEDFARTLKEIGRLSPEEFTAHTLSIKRSSRMNEFRDAFSYPSPAVVGLMRDAADAFSDMQGMSPYYLYRQKNTIGNLENVGYAKPGYGCIYNIHEMADIIDVIAVGAGAVSKVIDSSTGRIERAFNVKNLLEYINRVDEMIARKAKLYSGDWRLETGDKNGQQ